MLVGPIDRGQRSVLTAIADIADDQTGYGWPSVQTIANKTLFSTRYVIETISALEHDRWMKVEHRAVRGRYTAYTIDVDKLETLRIAQKQLEKQYEKEFGKKRTALNVSSERYELDLGTLHQSHMNSVHLSSEQGVEVSHEQSSPDTPKSHVNPVHVTSKSQVNSAQSQVNSAQSQVNSDASPNKKYDSSVRTITEGERPSDFPEGLSVQQYVTGIFELRGVVAGFGVRDLAAQAIKAIARASSIELHLAAVEFDQRVATALDGGEEINNFWFTDGKWKGDQARQRGHRSPLRDVPQFTPTNQADADADERESYTRWLSMSERFKRENPWKGRVFA